MRVTPLCSSAMAGLTALGITTAAALAGCGQLWRPFLDPVGCAESSTCNDLGTAQLDLTSVPADLSSAPWKVETSGTTQNLYGIWGTATTSSFSDGGIASGGNP